MKLHRSELVVDNFAGGGGASLGIEMALGRSPDIAINHDAEAVAMHEANHPRTRHYCEDVFEVDPEVICAGRRPALAWFSPDCKHFSKAKGGRPVDKNIRGLAWVVTRWAETVKPRVIILENVEEFAEWGPLLDDGTPDPERKGATFRCWWERLEQAGYAIESRLLRACDYGAPTIRKRLFVIARSDGEPIVWPEPTHGPGTSRPYRTAAECIDWTLPCPSIFERKRPLAEKTLRRIARGIQRFVIEAAEPFVIPVTHAGDLRSHSVSEPFRTVTGAHRGEHALVTPSFVVPVKSWGGGGNEPRGLDEPLRTVTSSKRGEHALVAPTLVQTGYGERPGQDPRALDLHAPLGTVVGCGVKHALVGAFLARHYGEREGGWNGGAPLTGPAPTVTTRDHNALVAASLVNMRGAERGGRDVREPMPTLTAQGTHVAEVRAFLTKYYGTGDGQRADDPLGTVTTRDRFGLVTVEGVDYAIADIGMRMLAPRELFRAQGFPDSYLIDVAHDGKPLTKTAQVRMCGNSVAPPVAAALVRANVGARRRIPLERQRGQRALFEAAS